MQAASAYVYTGTSHPDELAPGTELFRGQYQLERTLSSGGFGITYLARDFAGNPVVIKECFPVSQARRVRNLVRPRNSAGQAELTMILKHFLYEARSLSSLRHPNIVRVHQVFQENNTAYMALDYLEGTDLLQHIKADRSARNPAWILGLTTKLLGALAYAHAHDVLHRDISPDNVFIDTKREPTLIDFGASAWLSAPKSQSTMAVVKHGYSPHELYYADGNVGPWSDIYALGATLYHTITGEPPADSMERITARVDRGADPVAPLAGTLPSYPAGFLETIDRAMRVVPGERYQTAADWLSDLQGLDPNGETNVRFLEKALGLTRPVRPDKPAAAAKAKPDIAAEQGKEPNLKGNEVSLDITALGEIAGFIGACLVDSESGMMMAAVGGGKLDLESASAANTEVVRAKNRAIQMLGLNDKIEDILITLGKQYHLVRPLEKAPSVFIYVALDKKAANLGLARMQVKQVEQTLSI